MVTGRPTASVQRIVDNLVIVLLGITALAISDCGGISSFITHFAYDNYNYEEYNKKYNKFHLEKFMLYHNGKNSFVL